jgi:hypothetical protein
MDFVSRKAFFALFAVLALTAGAVSAQQPRPGSSDAPDPYLQPPPPGKPNWLIAYFQRYNCGCASHHNDLGCTSGIADCKFIFGSCRTFWSEPCPQGPSPYNFVPPQSTKPPSQSTTLSSRFSGLLHGKCTACEQAAP